MNLKVLGSGSSGNCYLLETDTECLIIDAGLPIREIKRGLNYDISKVSGVVVSHRHLDHALSVQNLEQIGLTVVKPYEQEEDVVIQLGAFKIQSFRLPHDGVPCRGVYITAEHEKVLYMTDMEYCPYNFKALKINHMLIECNYQEEYVNMNAENYGHKVRGHSSLATCRKFVEENSTSELRTVLLLHLGLETSNGHEMVDEITKVANKGAYVDYARAGLSLELKRSLCPF